MEVTKMKCLKCGTELILIEECELSKEWEKERGYVYCGKCNKYFLVDIIKEV
jgi:transcription elongation factor Elf1